MLHQINGHSSEPSLHKYLDESDSEQGRLYAEEAPYLLKGFFWGADDVVNKCPKEPYIKDNTGRDGNLFLLVSVKLEFYPWFKVF